MKMDVLYIIKDWKDIYETHDSRKYKGLNWVALPNRWDGRGFRRAMKHERHIEIFAAWPLILQIASRCQVRGTLQGDDGVPLTAQDMEDKTGLDVKCFDIALNVLSSQEIGWIEVKEISRNLPELPGTPGDSGKVRENTGYTNERTNEQVRTNEQQQTETNDNTNRQTNDGAPTAVFKKYRFPESFKITNCKGAESEIKVTFYRQVLRNCGDDMNAAALVFYRAHRKAENVEAWIRKGQDEGYADDPIEDEVVNKRKVNDWIEKNIFSVLYPKLDTG